MSYHAPPIAGRFQWMLLFGALLFGLLLPHLAGLLQPGVGPLHLLLSYLHFVAPVLGASFVVYRLHHFSRRWVDWDQAPRKRLLWLLIVYGLVAVACSFLIGLSWYWYPGARAADWTTVAWITGLGAVFIFFLAHALETAGLVHLLLQRPIVASAAPPPPIQLLARRGRAYVPIALADIGYVFTYGKTVFVCDYRGKIHRLDGRLREVEAVLPDDFFRVNRAYLVHRRAVASFRPITNGRLALALDPPAQREVTVSRQKARRFREWIGVEVREGVVSASEMYSP